ncbi:SUMF1/EgtB/PvdO family nonheme iron enzyme [Fibrobacter sp. UWH4]|uniref:formylglycine-generating enzyme family protein n=1 Tax=Fibrobacter sp. UWH4 TaxID=1896210 RepID=UPI00091F65C1|nr:SUMF1/EgtB/PvdO family nonheme iron enzyme [Fibrobacter sp. UWH4]SHK22792.1 Sulfatase-modifying factor enzyme 1 [Fibrobacter sp. UWH4]
MHKISSGVIAVTFIAGMFVGCSESPESGLTPPAEGDSSATIPPDSSNADSPQGISSGAVVDDSSTYSSSGFLTASSSDNVLAISSSSDELATHSCSSSGTEFSYIAPANFTDTVNGVLFDMVHVPGGSYTRGCDNCAEQDKIYETPAHKVTVSDYFAAKTEVTVSQWNAVMGGKKNAWESGNAPKIGVSWFDANNFACKLGKLTGRQYRLLTDAEWEFAARGGKDGIADGFKFSGGNAH